MFKWIKELKELVKDVLVFLRLRMEQQKTYSPIIDDLEAINALSNALNDQIRKFAQKWDLFPEIKKMLFTYQEYVEGSQKICRVTRKEILNNLLAQRNKKLIEDGEDSLQVHRQQNGDELDWKALIDAIAQKNPLVGKILDSCDKVKTGNVVYIQITSKNRMFLNTLLKYKAMIEYNCRMIFNGNISVEIAEVETEDAI